MRADMTLAWMQESFGGAKGPKDVALGQKVAFSGWLGLFNLSSSHLWDLGWPCRAGERSKGTGWGRGLVARLK